MYAVVLWFCFSSRWRHQMETFSALLALCEGNSPVTGEFPSQSPVTQSFEVFFDLCLNKRLNKQSWGWWFEMPSRSLWRTVMWLIHWCLKKMDIFHTTFPYPFVEQKVSYLDLNCTDNCFWWSTWQYLIIISGNGLRPNERMMTKFYGAI